MGLVLGHAAQRTEERLGLVGLEQQRQIIAASTAFSCSESFKASTRPVERVARIGRQAVVADVAAIAARVVGPFALVTIGAQRLQRAEREGVPIAAMRADDGRRPSPATTGLWLEAGGAQRLDAQGWCLARLPALKAIPIAPVKGGCGIGGEPWHRK